MSFKYLQGLWLKHFPGQSVPYWFYTRKKIRQCSIYNQNIRSGIYPLELVLVWKAHFLNDQSVELTDMNYYGGKEVHQLHKFQTLHKLEQSNERKKHQLLSHNTINSSLTGLFSEQSPLSDFTLSETNPVWQFPRPCVDFSHYSNE